MAIIDRIVETAIGLEVIEKLTTNSSFIDEIDYNPISFNLTILFKSGEGYIYYNVPPTVYAGLLIASSTGTYFNANIRNNYETEKQ